MNKKTLIILLIVAIVLIVTAVWVTTLTPQNNTVTDEEAKSYPVWDISDKSVTEISVSLPDESYTFIKTDSDMYSYRESPSAELNQMMISRLETFLKNVIADEKATDDAFSLSDYGFDNPKSEVKVTYASGEIVCRIGNLTQGKGYFFNMEGSDEVYVLQSQKALALMQPIAYFRNPSLHSADAQMLTVIEYDNKEGRIRLEKTPSSTGEEAWNMTSPIKKSADATNIDAYISQYLSLIQAKEYVEDNASDLSKYGLGPNAKKLYFEDNSGSFGCIYIGKTHSSGVYTYARKEGSNNVVSVESKNLEFMNMNMFTFVDSLINLEVLADVTKVEFKKGNIVHTMEIRRSSDSRKENENLSEYYINNTRVSVSTFKNIYTSLIGLDIERLAENVSGSTPLYEVTYFKNDGTNVSIHFVKHTERHYGAFVEGECKYIVLKEKLDNIFNQFEKIK